MGLVDAFTRDCRAPEVNTSFASRTVALAMIIADREKPLAIRCDKGLEPACRQFLAWCI